MEALGPLIGENLGIERAPIEVAARRACAQRHGSATPVDFEIEDVVPFGIESGEPARLIGIFHPAGSELTISSDAPRASRFRDRVRGCKAGFTTALRLGRLSYDDAAAAGAPRAATGDRAHSSVRRRRARLGLIALLLALAALACCRRPRACPGWMTARVPRSAALGWFLGVWVVMMAAMMFPSVAPTVGSSTPAWAGERGRRSRSAPESSPPATCATWTAAGLGRLRRSFALGRALLGGALSWDGAGRWGRRRPCLVLGRGLRADAPEGRLPVEGPQSPRRSCWRPGARAGPVP